MYIAVDTSTAKGIIACLEGSSQELNLLAVREWTGRASHSESAGQVLADLQAGGFLQFEKLSGVLVGVGPGSFTGVRVGINLARSLSYALNLPVIATDSLHILAQSHGPCDGKLVVAVNAQRLEMFVSHYLWSENGEAVCLEGPTVLRESELKQLEQEDTTVIIDPVVTAEGLMASLKAGLAKGPKLTWRDVHPLYLRRSAAEEKLASGALRPTRTF